MKEEQKVYIKGDAKRYKQVIKTLKDLGGINRDNLSGNDENAYYYISPIGWIEYVVINGGPLYSFIKEFYKEIRFSEEEDLEWKPKYGEKYYYINDSGIIDASYWRDNMSDKCRYDIGNCFKYGDGSIRTILEMLGNIFVNKKRR